LLEDIRMSYERERQPETLKEASGYLARLTQGHYRRVWTPLGEKTLRVDDAAGHSLPVESLSRGTREQLFLSLRLALAASYARRGAALPMVLDDVLVNFDTGRATAAAELLRDFAALGHQLLVCTCHEHIEGIFAQLDASPCRLPSSSQAGGALIAFNRASAAVPEESKCEKPRPAPRRKPVAKSKAAEEDATIPPEEMIDEPPLPAPAPPPPAKKSPPLPKKSSPPKRAAKSQGVFDVDFFDPGEKETSPEIEESDEIEDDESLWQEEEVEEDLEDNGDVEAA
jgi:hypothetical protein